ncbi:MAG: right-handed parallel beta-helix repeat-containing protein [Eubacteriales bacterium]|nr:right-handed parallel beta-helix repeat-containing protein [Eubacteriales bacterium]
MKSRVISGIMSLALVAGLCLCPEPAVNVQAAPAVSGAEKEIAEEDRDMELQLLAESEVEISEEVFDMKMDQADGGMPELSEDFTGGVQSEIFEAPDENLVFGDGAAGGEVAFSDDSFTEDFGDGGTELFSEGEEPGTDTPAPGTEVTLQVEEGSDITGVLNSLLSEIRFRATDENPYKVIIPPGNYQVTGTICLYSNIHLYAVGAVITKTSPTKHVVVRFGNSVESEGGYDGYRNITIEGGTWDMNYESCEDKEGPSGFVGFRMGHASNVVVKDATFLNNLKSHFLEFGGVKGARVTGCTFRGYWEPYEGGGQECIQIDACRDYIFPGYAPFDGSVCEDIFIDGNTFENVFAGVGSHSMMFDRPYKNITITNNTFRNIKKRAVWCLNYQDSVVSGNTMENVGGGVYVRSIYSHNTHIMEDQQADGTNNQQAQNLTISDNTITMAAPVKIGASLWRSYGIQVIGEKVTDSDKGIPSAVYIVKGVTVKGNTVTGPGNGIRLCLAQNCEVTGNKVSLQNPKKFVNFGIYLGASSYNVVKDNTVEKARSVGVYVYNGSNPYKSPSTDNIVMGNMVSGCYEDGIQVDSESNKTTLNGNTSKGNQGSGIAVYRSTLTNLSENKVQNNQHNGIYAYHADIKAQKANVLQGNKAAYAMYMKGCTGKAQSLKGIQSNNVNTKVKKLTGKVVGGKTITVALKNNNKKIGNAKINSKGQYTVPIKNQKKGTVLVLSVEDKYKNRLVAEQKVK